VIIKGIADSTIRLQPTTRLAGLSAFQLARFLRGETITLTGRDQQPFRFSLDTRNWQKDQGILVISEKNSGFMEISRGGEGRDFYSINSVLNNPNYDLDGYNDSYPAIDVREKGYSGIFECFITLALLICKNAGEGKFKIFGDTIMGSLTKSNKAFLDSIGFEREGPLTLSYDLSRIDPQKGTPQLPDLNNIIIKGSRETPGENIRAGKRVYVSANHHYALLSWAEAYARGQIMQGSLLVHLDAHPDTNKNGDPSGLVRVLSKLRPARREAKLAVKEFIFSLPPVGARVSGFGELPPLTESVFIAPAVRAGLIGEMIWMPSHREIFGKKIEDGRQKYGEVMVNIMSPDRFAESLNQFSFKTSILDIDLDYFGCHDWGFRNPGSGLSIEEIREKIVGKLKPDIITIALSRGYTQLTEKQERELVAEIAGMIDRHD